MINPTGNCLPWWHNKFDNISKDRRVPSGCSLVINRNLDCPPESMRAFSEKWLKTNKLWDKPLTLDLYSLARHITSEVGSGTIEEMVAVGEACVNQAKSQHITVSKLLICANKNLSACGYYGQIGGGGIGRWASTASDPRPYDIYLADFILSGKTGNFNKGALDQNGPDSQEKIGVDPIKDVYNAAKYQKKFWIGHLPGVNPWHTLLYTKNKGVPPEQTVAELLRLISWKGNKTIAAEGLASCSRFNTPMIVSAVSGLAIVGGLIYLNKSKY